MSQYKKNILVGLTVLVSLILLGWMILRFSDAPMRLFNKPQIPIHLLTPTGEGLSEGSTVSYLGVTIGHVTQVRCSADQRSVVIDAVVDADPPPPGNVEGEIRTQLFGGGASINLVLVAAAPSTLPAESNSGIDEPATMPAAPVVPVGYLRADQKILTRFIGTGLMPPEIRELAVDLTKTSGELRRITQQVRQSELVPRIASTIDTLQADLRKAGDVLDKIHTLVSDQKMRDDLRQTLANFNDASLSAKEIGQDLKKLSGNANVRMDELAANGNKVLTTANERIETVSRQLGDRLDQLADILRELDTTAKNVNSGKGSAGKLINDPALYENLLDVSKELQLTIKSLRRVLDQWEQEGVPLKFK